MLRFFPIFDDAGTVDILSTRFIVLEGRGGKGFTEEKRCSGITSSTTKKLQVQNIRFFHNSTGKGPFSMILPTLECARRDLLFQRLSYAIFALDFWR